MALNFPDNPNVGDTFETWQWDGTKWVSAGSAIIIPSGITSTEIGYLDGVTSNIQDQIDSHETRLDVLDTAVASVANSIPAGVSSTEIGYLDGVTSKIQTQLNGKQATITGAATTIDTENLTVNRALISDANGKVGVSAVTSTEIGYLDGVASNIQVQLGTKVDGTGTANYIPKWSDSNTLGNSSVIAGTSGMTVGGKMLVTGAASNNSTFTSSGELAVKAGSTSNDPYISFHNQNGNRQGYVQYGDTFGRMRLAAAGDLYLGTNNQDNFTIDSTGRIGIATAAPKANLHVYAGTDDQGRFTDSQKLGNYPPAGESNSFGIVAETFGTDSGGLLLIVGDVNNDEKAIDVFNRTSPAKESVFKVNSMGSTTINLNKRDGAGDGTWSSSTPGLLIVQSTDSYALKISDSSTPDDTTPLIVDKNGSMAIGATTVTSGYKFDVIGSIRYTGSIVDGSDQRAKENVELADLDLCFETFKSLPIQRFEYADWYKHKNDRHVLGFVAQDVEKVLPKAVHTSPTASFIGLSGEAIEFADFKHLDKDQILMTHYGCTQKLVAMVESQAETIKSLEARLAALEAK